jgi:Aspartyl protease
MKKFGFEIEDEDSLIITVDCKVHGDNYTLALDTGASNTVIDLAALIILGYEVKDSIRIVEFETAKSSLFAYVFLVAEITALGITRKNMEICSYDFFNNNIFSDMHGVLGLDFFRDCKLCVDMVEREITVLQKSKQ